MKDKRTFFEKARKIISEEKWYRLPGRVSRIIMGKIYIFFLQRICWKFVALFYSCKLSKYPELRELYEFFRSTSKSTGVSNWDAVVLYETVRKLKPQYILEFGTGASTTFLALGLKHNHKENPSLHGKIISVEGDKSYFEHQQKIYPAHLAEFTELVYSELGSKLYGNEQGFYYKNVPEHPYELIWVDGPSLTDDLPFSGDVIDIIHYCHPDVHIMFDGRDKSATKTVTLIGSGYSLKHYPLLHMNKLWKVSR